MLDNSFKRIDLHAPVATERLSVGNLLLSNVFSTQNKCLLIYKDFLVLPLDKL